MPLILPMLALLILLLFSLQARPRLRILPWNTALQL